MKSLIKFAFIALTLIPQMSMADEPYVCDIEGWDRGNIAYTSSVKDNKKDAYKCCTARLVAHYKYRGQYKCELAYDYWHDGYRFVRYTAAPVK